MSKKGKSKNSIIKKAKKFERQGKYAKALKVCDSYLDLEESERSIILLKIDILVNLYNEEDFIKKINDTKVKITDFIKKEEEEELLKLYNNLDNFIDLNSRKIMNDEGGIFLAGGMLLDNLETILVINEMAKENSKENKEPFEIDDELKDFVKNVKKTSLQYLDLISTNPTEIMTESTFNIDEINKKIKQLIEPKNNSDSELDDNELDNISETSTPKKETDKTTTPEKDTDTEISTTEKETDKTTTPEKDTDTEISTTEKDTDTEIRASEEDSISEENSLKLEDTTELSPSITVEDEIKGLKEIITYLNDKNEFKKALIYQRRLVKLAREENIKAEEEHDSKQKTLSDF